MKRVIIIFSALCLTAGVWAQDDKPEQKLVVHLRSGEKVMFVLDEEPVTTFDGGQLVLTTSKTRVIYNLENVQKYTHEGVATGLDSPKLKKGDILVRQNNEMMMIEGLPADMQVDVYSADGKLILSKKASAGQATMLSLIGQPSGIYIVNAGSVSFKFVKQ